MLRQCLKLFKQSYIRRVAASFWLLIIGIWLMTPPIATAIDNKPLKAILKEKGIYRIDEPRIVIKKLTYELILFDGSRELKTYSIYLGSDENNDKEVRGDRNTPEGEFYICMRKKSKRFYRFLGLSYPDLKRAEYGLRHNLITEYDYWRIFQAINDKKQPPWNTRLGGFIGIHGMGKKREKILRDLPFKINWTKGCIALSDRDIEEIFSVARIGTPVIITQ